MRHYLGIPISMMMCIKWISLKRAKYDNLFTVRSKKKKTIATQIVENVYR